MLLRMLRMLRRVLLENCRFIIDDHKLIPYSGGADIMIRQVSTQTWRSGLGICEALKTCV